MAHTSFCSSSGEVASEELGAVREHPGPTVRDLNADEDVRRILVELVLHGLAGIRGDRGDVDEANDALVDARGGDGGAAIGMADEEDGAADTIERPLHRSHILLVGVQAVLDRDDFVPVRLQCRDYFAEARAVGPDAVAENDGRFGFGRHINLLWIEPQIELYRSPERHPADDVRCCLGGAGIVRVAVSR